MDLEELAREWPLPEGNDETRLYLAEKVLPTLVPGLEELLKEISRRSDETPYMEELPLNPLNWLGQWLMRHNPAHGQGLQAYGEAMKAAIESEMDERRVRREAWEEEKRRKLEEERRRQEEERRQREEEARLREEARQRKLAEERRKKEEQERKRREAERVAMESAEKERSRLLDLARKQRDRVEDETETLKKVAASGLQNAGGMVPVFRSAFDAIHKHTGATSAYLGLLEMDGSLRYVDAATEVERILLVGQTLNKQDGPITFQALKEGNMINIDNTDDKEDELFFFATRAIDDFKSESSEQSDEESDSDDDSDDDSDSDAGSAPASTRKAGDADTPAADQGVKPKESQDAAAAPAGPTHKLDRSGALVIAPLRHYDPGTNAPSSAMGVLVVDTLPPRGPGGWTPVEPPKPEGEPTEGEEEKEEEEEEEEGPHPGTDSEASASDDEEEERVDARDSVSPRRSIRWSQRDKDKAQAGSPRPDTAEGAEGETPAPLSPEELRAQQRGRAFTDEELEFLARLSVLLGQAIDRADRVRREAVISQLLLHRLSRRLKVPNGFVSFLDGAPSQKITETLDIEASVAASPLHINVPRSPTKGQVAQAAVDAETGLALEPEAAALKMNKILFPTPPDAKPDRDTLLTYLAAFTKGEVKADGKKGTAAQMRDQATGEELFRYPPSMRYAASTPSYRTLIEVNHGVVVPPAPEGAEGDDGTPQYQPHDDQKSLEKLLSGRPVIFDDVSLALDLSKDEKEEEKEQEDSSSEASSDEESEEEDEPPVKTKAEPDAEAGEAKPPMDVLLRGLSQALSRSLRIKESDTEHGMAGDVFEMGDTVTDAMMRRQEDMLAGSDDEGLGSDESDNESIDDDFGEGYETSRGGQLSVRSYGGKPVTPREGPGSFIAVPIIRQSPFEFVQGDQDEDAGEGDAVMHALIPSPRRHERPLSAQARKSGLGWPVVGMLALDTFSLNRTFTEAEKSAIFEAAGLLGLAAGYVAAERIGEPAASLECGFDAEKFLADMPESERYPLVIDLLEMLILRRSVLRIDPKAIAELRSYDSPPVVVHRVLRAALGILGHKRKELENWQLCRRLVGQPMLRQMAIFDPSAVMRRSRFQNARIAVKKISGGDAWKHGSAACGHLHNWVISTLGLRRRSVQARSAAKMRKQHEQDRLAALKNEDEMSSSAGSTTSDH